MNIAISKNIVDKKHLIPVRLDRCEVPECLRYTLWQDIPDLENYEEQLKRIVNAIYGQYEKLPLGAAPAYVQLDILNIGELTKIDSAIFEHACHLALEQRHAVIISGEQLVTDMHKLGISEEQIMETQEVLDGRSYIEMLRVMGPPHVYDFGITTTGFEEFAGVGIKDYARICADVGRILVRRVIQEQGQTSKHEIAKELNQPLLVIEHILKVFESRGLVEYAESMGGSLHGCLSGFS